MMDKKNYIYEKGINPINFEVDIFKILSRVKIKDNTQINITDCWEWQGAKNNMGYGYIKQNKKAFRVHRLVWEVFNSTLTPGMIIDHICMNPSCCNPEHLREVNTLINAKFNRRIKTNRGVIINRDNSMDLIKR